MYQRDMTAEERAELDGLNRAVTDAVANRKKWLDLKMHEVAKFKVGDEIFNVESGKKLGVVTGLYRYSANRDKGFYDTSLSVDYYYSNDPDRRVIENTSSRYYEVKFGTREDVARRAAAQLKALADSA